MEFFCVGFLFGFVRQSDSSMVVPFIISRCFALVLRLGGYSVGR